MFLGSLVSVSSSSSITWSSYLQIGGCAAQIFEFQTCYISSNIDQIPSYIPPIEIPKVWWCYIFALCGYQPPYRSTFGHRGIGFGGESSQIWRQLVSETMGISTYRQTPSTLLDQHAHHGGFDSIDVLHSSIHNSINNRDTHIILYGMVGHFMLLSAAWTYISSDHISKIDILSRSTSAQIVNNRYHDLFQTVKHLTSGYIPFNNLWDEFGPLLRWVSTKAAELYCVNGADRLDHRQLHFGIIFCNI